MEATPLLNKAAVRSLHTPAKAATLRAGVVEAHIDPHSNNNNEETPVGGRLAHFKENWPSARGLTA